MITVLKFGGTSVATVEKIQAIADYLKKRTVNEKLCVVVSAMGKRTDALIGQVSQITQTPNPRELDRLLSIGEQETIALLAIALQNVGVTAYSMTGIQAGIRTAGKHTRSKIIQIDAEKIEQQFTENDVVIIAGFQGVNENNDITTLGRGGSDTTAVALAASLHCDCEIYTDVTGIFTTDPRVYPKAKQLEVISYDEMMEMSALGASVMETRSVELGKKYGVKIYVGKTLDTRKGTYIMDAKEILEQKVISAISTDKKILFVELQLPNATAQMVATIFKTISEEHVNVDMISQNNNQSAISFTCPENEYNFLQTAVSLLQTKYPELQVKISQDYAKLSVVGIGMRDAIGVAAKVFTALSAEDISFHQITTSEISISLVIAAVDSEKATIRLCNEFNL